MKVATIPAKYKIIFFLVICMIFCMGFSYASSGKDPYISFHAKELRFHYIILNQSEEEQVFNIDFEVVGNKVLITATLDQKKLADYIAINKIDYATFSYTTIKNMRVERDKTILNIPAKLENGITPSVGTVLRQTDSVIYSVLSDPTRDKRIKLGDNSIVIIIVPDTSYPSIDVLTSQHGGYMHLNLSTEPPYDTLIAYWSFDSDDSVTAYDYGKYGMHGTYEGNAYTNTSGKYFKSAGSTAPALSRIRATSIPAEVQAIHNYSISFWLYMDLFTTTQRNLDLGYPTGVIVRTISGAAPKVQLIGGTFTNSLSTINKQQWTHVVMVCNSTGDFIFMNGTLDKVGTTACTKGIGTSIYPMGSSADYFNGTIDEVMIFNKSLNSSEVADIFNTQSPRFEAYGEAYFPFYNTPPDTNNINLTLNYNRSFSTDIEKELFTWVYADGYQDGIYTVDPLEHFTMDATYDGRMGNAIGTGYGSATFGTGHINASFKAPTNDSYIDIDNVSGLSPSDEVTVMAWVNMTKIDAGQTYFPVVSNAANGKPASSNTPFWLGIYSDDGIVFSIKSFVGNGSTYKSNTGTDAYISLGEWNHLAFSFDGGTGVLKTYVNGILYNNQNLGGGFSMTTNASNVIHIGSRSSSVNTFYGEIDDIMIFDAALSDNDIQAAYLGEHLVYNPYCSGSITGIDANDNESLDTCEVSNNTNAVGLALYMTSDASGFFTPYIYSSILLYPYSQGTVIKSDPDLSIIFNESNNLTYPQGVTVNGTGCPAGVTCNLYRNNTLISNPYTESPHTAGYYNYTFNTSGDGSYNPWQVSDIIQSNKSNSSCQILFNESSPLPYPMNFTVYSDCDSDFTIERNGSTVFNNTLNDLGVGDYNFSVTRTDQDNYSIVHDEYVFVVSKGTPRIQTFINGSRSNHVSNDTTLINITGFLIDNDDNISLWVNETLYQTASSPVTNFSYFPDGVYSIKFNYSGNENLTNGSETWILTISNVTLSPTELFFTTCPDGLEGKMLLLLCLVMIAFLYAVCFYYEIVLLELFTSLTFGLFSVMIYNCAEILGITVGIVAIMFIGTSFARIMGKMLSSGD